MTERETCRADELTEDAYVVNGSVVQRIAKAFTVGGRTTVIDGNGDSWRVSSHAPINLATAEEAQAYEDADDRARVADGFRRLAKLIEDRRLPVPSSLRDVKVDFTLHDSADLSGWAEVLRRRPVKHVPSLLPSMSSDELGMDVCIVGGTGEFGPELGESVEHRDSVGAFPVVPKLPPLQACARCGCAALLNAVELCTECESEAAMHAIDEMRAEEERPEREGFAPPSGHAVQAPAEALKYDRFNDGGTEA